MRYPSGDMRNQFEHAGQAPAYKSIKTEPPTRRASGRRDRPSQLSCTSEYSIPPTVSQVPPSPVLIPGGAMPALDMRAGFVSCTFFHTASRRNAVIHSSAQTCRRDQRKDESCTDKSIIHCRTGVITRAAPAQAVLRKSTAHRRDLCGAYRGLTGNTAHVTAWQTRTDAVLSGHTSLNTLTRIEFNHQVPICALSTTGEH